MSARVALIHAVKVAIAPVEDAFKRLWPEARLVNLLDDSLSVDRSRTLEMTPEIKDRIASLAAYSVESGADAILFTCSAFGEAIEAVQRAHRIPVLKPNEAMFTEALGHGRRLGMLATFEPSVAALEAELRFLQEDVVIKTVCVPQALTALQAGDGATHDGLLARAAGSLGDCDAVMLAQFSTARARGLVAQTVACPVLTSPASAVQRLRTLL
jgi:Asp/Glu/hydantoin racemase